MLTSFLVIVAFTFAAFMIGVLLSLAAHKFKVEPKDPMQHLVEQCLPQVQCGQCGYVGCAEYATAVLNGEAPINLCTPGGEATVKALADLLHMPMPSDLPTNSEESMAHIIAEKCIGCGKCAKVCPYDAISGVIKQCHVVDTQYCTGCTKCVACCPTSCIEMQIVEQTTQTWDWNLHEDK